MPSWYNLVFAKLNLTPEFLILDRSYATVAQNGLVIPLR